MGSIDVPAETAAYFDTLNAKQPDGFAFAGHTWVWSRASQQYREAAIHRIVDGASESVIRYLEGDDGTSFEQFWVEQAEWSQKTFGTDSERGPVGALKHLAKEALEAMNEKQGSDEQAEEIADCLFLVIDAARRAGMTPDKLLTTAKAKLQKNREREWPDPKTQPADSAIEHVEGQ